MKFTTTDLFLLRIFISTIQLSLWLYQSSPFLCHNCNLFQKRVFTLADGVFFFFFFFFFGGGGGGGDKSNACESLISLYIRGSYKVEKLQCSHVS